MMFVGASQTKKFGEQLAKQLAKQVLKAEPRKNAFVIGLIGELGGGKTTFLQGFAKGLGIEDKILSPTFVIMKRFVIDYLPFTDFYHIDCYRIKKPQELLSLGFADILREPKNIVVIEWADKIKKILPKDALMLKFRLVDARTREIEIIKKGVIR